MQSFPGDLAYNVRIGQNLKKSNLVFVKIVCYYKLEFTDKVGYAMIEYSKTSADTKNRVKDLAWANGRYLVVFAALVFPFALYHLLVGYVAQQGNALKLGIQLTTLTVVLLAIYLILYYKLNKAVKANFENYAEEDRIDFTLENFDENTLLFTRLTDEETFEVRRIDVKRIKHMKTIHVIFLRNKKTIDLPRREDIDEILKCLQ